MLILYALVIGIAAGAVAGGDVERLSELRVRWAPLAVAGFIVQIALFTDAGSALAGGAAPAIYVVSTAAVLVAVLRNVALPGLPVVAAGAAANLVAIIANGGYMPADPGALAVAGGLPSVAQLEPAGYSNSLVTTTPALRPLTDIFALPAGVPFANVFSVGDVLIGVGIAVAIFVAMRRRPA